MSSDRQKLAQTAAELGDAPSSLQIAKAGKVLEALDASEAGLLDLRMGVVCSFTFDMLVRPLVVRGYCEGFRLTVYNAPYGQYVQELVNPASGLHACHPDVVLLALRLHDVCSVLYEGFNALNRETVEQAVSEWQQRLLSMLQAFRQTSSARILCTNYEQPAYPSLGLADRRSEPSQVRAIQRLNEWLFDLTGQVGDFHVVDIDSLAAVCGRARWVDPKLQLWARSPIRPEFHWAFAGEVMRVLRATTGRSRKVLALDCDNTLWGGVLGDVGIDGIALGHDYPGSAFVALQKRALELYHRGVVLVVASKNDPQNVREVFERHPEMILRPEHIACFAVNWEPKPGNLRQAAEILNLGLDSFVFVDDHPVECAMMRELLPEVLTVQLPEDPAAFESTLARLDCFDQLTVSEEDRSRGAMYRQEAARAELRAQAGDLESFFRGLEMKMCVVVNDEGHVPRAAQLTQRTNQFNMTTIRRTESDITALMRSNDAEVITLRLADRFGDHGIVGLAVVRRGSSDWVLETFLMSCRVLGRTVEQSFLAWIGRRAMAAGAARLVAHYRPTKKNTPFGRFYESCGLRAEESGADGAQRWALALEPGAPALAIPAWINCESPAPQREQA